MINGEFMGAFPPAYTEFLEPRFFDHCAGVIVLGKPFKLEAGPFKI